MRALTLHLRVLIFLLISVGLGITFYQIVVLKTPIVENEIDNLWTIDAKVSFEVKSTKPVRVQFFIPKRSADYTLSDELFLANDYGQNINDNVDNNRAVIWSARKRNGKQLLYYRANISKRYVSDDDKNNKQWLSKAGTVWREAMPVDGLNKVAVDALIDEIRQKSSNTMTFISTAINMLNDQTNSNSNLLLGKDQTLNNKLRILALLLSQAHIPIQKVHTIRLINSINQQPEAWIRSYIETDKNNTDMTVNNGQWYYFNPNNGNVGLSEDHLIWWVGDKSVINTENVSQLKVTFDVSKSELTAITLAKQAQAEGNYLGGLSFYSLPASNQISYQLMVVIPFGVLIILILRNLVGINTLGTFTPVLIALAFRETGLFFGICFFSLIVAIGLSLRSYLEHLKLQMLPRLSVVLISVVLLIVFAGLFSYKVRFEQGLSVTLFPMVILTMTIERLSITWEERGAAFALKVALGTLITASIAYMVMNIHGLMYFVFTFPGVLLIIMAFMLAMGRYRGYRLLELIRFKAMAKE